MYKDLCKKWEPLFPAHAGVILLPDLEQVDSLAVPRTRGGDPFFTLRICYQIFCSPHTRG